MLKLIFILFILLYFIYKDFRKSFNLTFMFRIVLHKDDLAVLESSIEETY